VNNFAAAPGRFGWLIEFISGYALARFPASAGQVLTTPVALTTLSLLTGPSGGAWPSNDYSEGVADYHDDFLYVAVKPA
jgi:hypothetical protein